MADPRAAVHAALVQLLVEKGVITFDEYQQKAAEALAIQMSTREEPPTRTKVH